MKKLEEYALEKYKHKVATFLSGYEVGNVINQI